MKNDPADDFLEYISIELLLQKLTGWFHQHTTADQWTDSSHAELLDYISASRACNLDMCTLMKISIDRCIKMLARDEERAKENRRYEEKRRDEERSKEKDFNKKRAFK